MSTPDRPDTPPLTRRRLREIRNTGATPVVPPGGEGAEQVAEQPAPAPTPAPVPPPAAPLPRASEPAQMAPPPVRDAHVNLGVAPLTRRQAREQERIRTASVPVIAPDAAASAPALAEPAVVPVQPEKVARVTTVPSAGVSAPAPEAPRRSEKSGRRAAPTAGGAPSPPRDQRRDEDTRREREREAAVAESASRSEEPTAVVNPHLGSDLLESGEPPAVALPPSFDSLITRGPATGSATTPNALILSQTPAAAPLVAPVTATGEVIITGTFDLPDELGSKGHAAGTTDGKDIDMTLIDGELPPASSPTPIAASAAISTVRNNDEIIRPPAPESGNRLMLALIITAGVLALALAGVLILAFVTGMF